ncbi:hypothetical protein TNCT_144661 [Trichonephila clavata]|uniref:Uncharacterized protein n=1 Tax=Trichonephila clavata TaxID=2740835 RepID=A0A8X6LDM5_TRICU|nr:hypothetical protein TNCT_144661 [Trichonephila clavata]
MNKIQGSEELLKVYTQLFNDGKPDKNKDITYVLKISIEKTAKSEHALVSDLLSLLPGTLPDFPDHKTTFTNLNMGTSSDHEKNLNKNETQFQHPIQTLHSRSRGFYLPSNLNYFTSETTLPPNHRPSRQHHGTSVPDRRLRAVDAAQLPCENVNVKSINQNCVLLKNFSYEYR